ncbi:MAG TPA: YigZ family protein [Bacteroidia bacterium]|nr:YigZ family protein [Bacteroidia bacterium]HNU32724.1 YigZ family protein [Bacteroidia bacterium]
MLFDVIYKTITTNAESICKDKGSKFIAFAFAVATEAEIKQHLKTLKDAHAKANHHCYAWRLGAAKTNYRVNDDGEPAGSAGKPIFGVIQSHDLTNVLIVVVRYFGGTLLGIPGLINAYKTAAQQAVAQSTIIEKPITEIYTLEFGYEVLNMVMPKLKQKGINILSQHFADQNIIRFEVEKAIAQKVISELTGNYLLKDKLVLKAVI